MPVILLIAACYSPQQAFVCALGKLQPRSAILLLCSKMFPPHADASSVSVEATFCFWHVFGLFASKSRRWMLTAVDIQIFPYFEYIQNNHRVDLFWCITVHYLLLCVDPSASQAKLKLNGGQLVVIHLTKTPPRTVGNDDDEQIPYRFFVFHNVCVVCMRFNHFLSTRNCQFAVFSRGSEMH